MLCPIYTIWQCNKRGKTIIEKRQMRYNADKQDFREKRRVFQGEIREGSGRLSITLQHL